MQGGPWGLGDRRTLDDFISFTGVRNAYFVYSHIFFLSLAVWRRVTVYNNSTTFRLDRTFVYLPAYTGLSLQGKERQKQEQNTRVSVSVSRILDSLLFSSTTRPHGNDVVSSIVPKLTLLRLLSLSWCCVLTHK